MKVYIIKVKDKKILYETKLTKTEFKTVKNNLYYAKEIMDKDMLKYLKISGKLLVEFSDRGVK